MMVHSWRSDKGGYETRHSKLDGKVEEPRRGCMRAGSCDLSALVCCGSSQVLLHLPMHLFFVLGTII